jgi:thiosulfate sulfurtransferase
MMGQFKHISIGASIDLLAAGDVHLVDIRDQQSFSAAHINGAKHLDNTSLQDFIAEANSDIPVIVCCYHGNSSQSAAAFLNDKGFEEVYSMDGGFEQWRTEHPIVSE